MYLEVLQNQIQDKRVLHFKSAKHWFHYNEKFGTGSLKETYYGGSNDSRKKHRNVRYIRN